MKKIIGLVHTRFSPHGGVENYINKLVPSLILRGWKIHYLTSMINQDVPSEMTVHKIPVIRGFSTARMLSFAYGARKKAMKLDLPLIMGFGRTIYQDIYRDGSGCFLDYEKNAQKNFNRLYRKTYLHLEKKRFSDPRLKKIITVSNMVKEQIIARYRVPDDKIQVVYSGVNAGQLNPDLKKQKDHFKKELNINKDDLTILFIGNGFKRKGLDYLIDAIGHIKDEIPVRVLVAGNDKKTGSFKKRAAAAGCAEKFRFLGYQNNVGSLYGASDLFVLPSLFDPIANVVLESLYTGTPVVTGDQVGGGELVENGINGFVLHDYNPDTLSRAILSFYHSKEKDKMKKSAHGAAAPYRWDLHMDLLENIFFEIIMAS